MNKQILRRACFWLCILLSLTAAMPALAQGIEESAAPQPSATAAITAAPTHTDATSEPSTAPTTEPTAEPTQEPAAPAELAILLNGQPVTSVIMNLSTTKQLQFTATEPVTWKSSKTYRGTIDANGLFTADSASTLTVTAKTADGRTATCQVRMKRLLTDVTVSGSHEVAAGKKIRLTASTAPSNAGDRNVVWSSSDPSVAQVNSYGYVTAKNVSGVQSVVIRAEARDGGGAYAEHIVTVHPAAKSVSIQRGGETVKSVYIDLNTDPTMQLSAVVFPEEAGQSVTWKSNSSRVSVDKNGMITGKKTGSAVVTATAADGTGRKTTVNVYVVRMVTDISISGSSSVTGGKSISLSKSVLPSNATKKDVTWSSSDESIATVNRYGKVTAKRLSEVKTVVITAAATDGSGVIAQHTITVTPPIQSMSVAHDGEAVKKLTVDINSPVVNLNTLIQPADACQDVKWTSSSSSRASVTQEGVVTVKRTGSVTITATAQDGSGKRASVTLNVIRPVQSITVTGAESLVSRQSGKVRASVLPSNATNDDVTWSSSDPSVLTVNKYGSLKAARVDSAHQVTITAVAKDGSGVVGERIITVVPTAQEVRIFAGGEQVSTLKVDLTTCRSIDLDAVIAPSDASQAVRWSSNSSRAKVDSDGVVTFSKTGSATITATAKDGSGKRATVKITIIRAVESISISGDMVAAGGEGGDLDERVLPSNATNDDVTWSSSDPELLTINRYGTYETVNVDSEQQVTVTATAKDGSGVVGTAVVTILPRTEKVTILRDGVAAENVGIDLSGTKMMQLTAQVEPAGAMQAVRWTSSNTRYATVDANGMVTGRKAGTVTITATAADGTGVRGKVTLTVGTMVKSLNISGATQMTGGGKIDLDSTAYPSNATKKSVVWSSSDKTLATVDADGEVKASQVDVPTQVTITATAKDGGGAAAHHTLTILPAARSISISRSDADMASTLILNANGGTAQLQASVYPAIANQNVKWTSSNRSVVRVDANGRVTAYSSGIATITATAADGSGVKAVLRVGVGKVAKLPYYIEVDIANQVVRVYERGADNSYSTLIKRMICSTGKNSSPTPTGLYSLNGSRMVWMTSLVRSYAIYATRIEGHYLFHSVPYPTRSASNLDTYAYEMLGSKASAGCVRLLASDSKWIYDNVPKGCFIYIMNGVRDIDEYGTVTKPALGSGNWDPTNPDPNNPDYDPTYNSDVPR